MNIAVDDQGNPFILIREQEKKKRLKGDEAHRANILAARQVAETLKTSFGPKGMDKIVVSPDGDVTVTNDGATVMEKMEISHQCARLLAELSKSQDAEVGDGTTGVVILAGAFLEQAQRLLDKKHHPLTISDGFEIGCQIALKRLDEISDSVNTTTKDKFKEYLISAAMTALSSKVVSSQQKILAEICVNAVLSVADLERQDVNFDLIKLEGKPGGKLEDSCMVNGIVLNKDLSHPQMRRVTNDAKIAILTCPFEPPKPKTKHKIDIKSAADCQKLIDIEKEYFVDMVRKVKNSGANFVICQWGFDDEANHLLMTNDIPAIRWVGGVEVELIAIATGGRIIPRFEELSAEKLGHAQSIKELRVGTEDDRLIVIEGAPGSRTVTILVRGGNQMAVDEAKRCMHDALCVVRNLIREPKIVAGGGAAELACAISVEDESMKIKTMEQNAVAAFAEALASIPETLAENAGYDPIKTSSLMRTQQITEKNPNFGVSVEGTGVQDMLKINVHESLHSKKNQISLATQVVKMILKIDDVIAEGETDD